MKFPRSILFTTVTLALQLANPAYALPTPCSDAECASQLEARTYVVPSQGNVHYKRQFDFDLGGLFGGGDDGDDSGSGGIGGIFGNILDSAKDAVVKTVKDKATELKDKAIGAVKDKVKEKVGDVVGDIFGGGDDDAAAADVPPAAAPAAAPPAAAPPAVAPAAAAPPAVAPPVAAPPPAVTPPVAGAVDNTAGAADAAADPAAGNDDVEDVSVAAGTCGAPGINGATVNLIKSFEGFVASPEPDPIGLPTAGFGHLCKKANCAEVPFSFPLTDGPTGTAAQLLQQDVRQFVTCINGAVNDSVVLNDNQFGALVSWAFNVGCGAAKKSTLIRRLNAGENKQTVISQELPKFNRAGGKVLKGLTRRRAAEVKLAATASNVQAHPC